MQRKIESGFCKGQFTLEGLGEYSEKLYTVDFQNENLIIKCDEAVRQIVVQYFFGNNNLKSEFRYWQQSLI